MPCQPGRKRALKFTPRRPSADRVSEDEILADLRELFLTPDELTYEMVEAAAQLLHPGVYVEEFAP